jgi:hypothetical protein
MPWFVSLTSLGHISLPRRIGRVGSRIIHFGTCSAFTHVAACILAKSPKVTLYTEELFSHRIPRGRSDCFRLERQMPGGIFTHGDRRAFPRRTIQ